MRKYGLANNIKRLLLAGVVMGALAIMFAPNYMTLPPVSVPPMTD